MFRFVKRRAFLLVLGFLLVAVFIWYAGPYFAFADYQPLESATARLIAIALVVAFWVASVLFRRLRAFRASDRLVAAVLRQPQAEEDRPSAEAVKLRERFEEAVATLKERRRGGHSLYDLPWYVIIGAPGSGKTTALLNSGLNFPLEQRVGKGALRGVGGTRNCDWWFTDEAVFLDTAGRYTTQDSDASSDSAGWGEFLALLRKYRRRRPVNGVILTISAQDLMVQGEAGREAHVEAARRRLNELNRELHIRLPVYLMVTKCDLVAGFTEYFDDLAQEGRAQVWGVTFPYEQTVGGGATQAFPVEFETLIARLNARVFARLEEDRDVRRRTKVFAFPQQMAAMRDFLVQFVAEVFASTHLDQPILLRGVYFTSGTQDGTPIDRLLGAIGRGFGVASDVVAPSSGRGKAYFVERMLKEVLIGESGLAGVNRRLEMQKAAAQLGAYVAMGLAAALGVIAMSVSYGRNRAYITAASADIASLHAVPTVGAAASLEAQLPRLNAMRAVVDSTNRYRTDVPWAMRWGLYQGASVGNAARDAYVRELDGILLPRFAALMKKRLVDYGPEPEKLYEYLKGYLMLGEPRHLDKRHLQTLADLEWPAAGGAAGVSASKHFQSLLEYGETLRPIALDPSLVAQARSTVRRASIPRIVYGRLKRSYVDDVKDVVRLDTAAGVGVEQVFRRKSGARLSEPVPGLYGRTVFKQVTGRDIPELVKQFAKDDWVWGESNVFAGSQTRLADVADIYERDYIAVWDGILNDLEIVSFSTMRQTTEALGILAGPTSPLPGLLRVVADNTTLIESPDAAQSPDSLSAARKKITDGFEGLVRPVQSALGVSTAVPGALVTAYFEPIHRLMTGAPGKTPLDPILDRIGQIEQQLRSLGPGVGDTDPLGALSSPVLRGLLQSLQDDAATLPPAVRTLVAQIGRRAEGSVVSGATSDLDYRYRQEVLETCLTTVAGRYPFTAGSPSDVPLADFGRLFGYGGVYDRFFSDRLAAMVDTSRSPWAWRPGSVSPSRAMLPQFEAAHRVREAFFREGSLTPQVSFTVTIGDLDASATRFVLQIDGQVFDNQHPRAQGAWPGQGSSGQAIATFEDVTGPWSLPNLTFESPWAWFRLIDSAQPRRDGDLGTVLTFQGGNHHARATVEAASMIHNPFAKRDWQGFSCGS